jgi:hypothetical protein
MAIPYGGRGKLANNDNGYSKRNGKTGCGNKANEVGGFHDCINRV